MKRITTALAVASLAALAACGGPAANNAAVVNEAGGEDTYNVAPDDLTADNLSGNEAGNAAEGNAADANASGNAQ